QAREALRYRVQQNAAALVQRIDREPAPADGENQRRVDKAHIPPRVTAGKLEARRKQNPAPLLERLGPCGIGRLILVIADLSRNADAAVGYVARELHGDPSGWDPGRSALNCEGRPVSLGGLSRNRRAAAVTT